MLRLLHGILQTSFMVGTTTYHGADLDFFNHCIERVTQLKQESDVVQFLSDIIADNQLSRFLALNLQFQNFELIHRLFVILPKSLLDAHVNLLLESCLQMYLAQATSLKEKLKDIFLEHQHTRKNPIAGPQSRIMFEHCLLQLSAYPSWAEHVIAGLLSRDIAILTNVSGPTEIEVMNNNAHLYSCRQQFVTFMAHLEKSAETKATQSYAQLRAEQKIMMGILRDLIQKCGRLFAIIEQLTIDPLVCEQLCKQSSLLKEIIKQQHFELFTCIIKTPAQITAIEQVTPHLLPWVTSYGHDGVLKHLLAVFNDSISRKHFIQQSTGVGGVDALLIACNLRVRPLRRAMAYALLSAGAQPNTVSPGMQTPLVAVLRFGDHGLTKRLLALGADPSLYVDSNMSTLVKSGQMLLEAMKYHVAAKNNKNTLYERRFLRIALTLIAHDVSITEMGDVLIATQFPLEYACVHALNDIVIAIFKKHPDMLISEQFISCVAEEITARSQKIDHLLRSTFTELIKFDPAYKAKLHHAVNRLTKELRFSTHFTIDSFGLILSLGSLMMLAITFQRIELVRLFCELGGPLSIADGGVDYLPAHVAMQMFVEKPNESTKTILTLVLNQYPNIWKESEYIVECGVQWAKSLVSIFQHALALKNAALIAIVLQRATVAIPLSQTERQLQMRALFLVLQSDLAATDKAQLFRALTDSGFNPHCPYDKQSCLDVATSTKYFNLEIINQLLMTPVSITDQAKKHAANVFKHIKIAVDQQKHAEPRSRAAIEALYLNDGLARYFTATNEKLIMAFSTLKESYQTRNPVMVVAGSEEWLDNQL